MKLKANPWLSYNHVSKVDDQILQQLYKRILVNMITSILVFKKINNF